MSVLLPLVGVYSNPYRPLSRQNSSLPIVMISGESQRDHDSGSGRRSRVGSRRNSIVMSGPDAESWTRSCRLACVSWSPPQALELCVLHLLSLSAFIFSFLWCSSATLFNALMYMYVYSFPSSWLPLSILFLRHPSLHFSWHPAFRIFLGSCIFLCNTRLSTDSERPDIFFPFPFNLSHFPLSTLPLCMVLYGLLYTPTSGNNTLIRLILMLSIGSWFHLSPSH